MARYMYYCTNCFFLASTEGTDADETCPKCGRKLYQTGFPRKIWITKTEEEKNQIKNSWLTEYQAKIDELAMINKQNAEKDEALSKMLISSGFNFEGYKIVKYSDYISGVASCSISRSTASTSIILEGTLIGELRKIRHQALKDLKEEAYALGCNAVIGVDFDYITLEPETASATGGTMYQPYVIYVTVNGNAVIIEKEE